MGKEIVIAEDCRIAIDHRDRVIVAVDGVIMTLAKLIRTKGIDWANNGKLVFIEEDE